MKQGNSENTGFVRGILPGDQRHPSLPKLHLKNRQATTPHLKQNVLEELGVARVVVHLTPGLVHAQISGPFRTPTPTADMHDSKGDHGYPIAQLHRQCDPALTLKEDQDVLNYNVELIVLQ